MSKRQTPQVKKAKKAWLKARAALKRAKAAEQKAWWRLVAMGQDS